jgi:hypothetical protein
MCSRRTNAGNITFKQQQFLIAVKADRVRCPEAVAAYARGIAVRKSAAHIGTRIQERSAHCWNAEDFDLPESRENAVRSAPT